MNKLFLLSTLFSLSAHLSFGQGRIIIPSTIVDSTYGIEYYERFNAVMGNDSVRNYNGYAVKGNITDRYSNGQTLHKGYYIEGQLRTYTNYYPDGKIERQFKPISDIEFKLTKYYQNDMVKSEVVIKRNMTLSWSDFFENGNLELEELYLPESPMYKSKKTGYENGNLESELILVNKKKKLYHEKFYHPNGKLMTEGDRYYDDDALGYLRQGVWKVFDKEGQSLKDETYVNDQLQ
ncbi:MAG: hypothetical protein IT239_03520 [Bacteroidia bacterium]|nr:hypothetical protein [Bacteroidia bacterium]